MELVLTTFRNNGLQLRKYLPEDDLIKSKLVIEVTFVKVTT